MFVYIDTYVFMYIYVCIYVFVCMCYMYVFVYMYTRAVPTQSSQTELRDSLPRRWGLHSRPQQAKLSSTLGFPAPSSPLQMPFPTTLFPPKLQETFQQVPKRGNLEFLPSCSSPDASHPSFPSSAPPETQVGKGHRRQSPACALWQ